MISKIDIDNINDYNYIKNHFSRNTHIKNIKILKLPNIIEEIVWLNFSETERMIYNAYLADPNNNQYDVFIRQICCHPMISEKIRESVLNKVENLSDMKDIIKNMYFKDFDKSDENYQDLLTRISKIKEEMKSNYENENKTNLLGYINLKEDLQKANEKIVELKKIRDGKEQTVIYYKTFLDLISDMEKVTSQECPICMDNIKENDIGITYCGHIFCYSCINTIVKESKSSCINSKCPNCNKKLENNNIFMISQNISKDVNELGTKLAYIINYIKKLLKNLE